MADYAAPWHLKLLGVVAPKRAAVLTHFDRLSKDDDYAEAVGFALRARGYKAARTGPGLTPWRGAHTQRSADGEVLFDLPRLRARSRLANRDDPIASGLLRNFTNDVVGTGITWQSDDEGAEASWREIRDGLFPAEGMSFWEAQRLLYAKLLEDGEVLVKRSVANGELFFEVAEADRLATPHDAQPQDPEGQIREGVERDGTGRVVAYWIAKRHPGDTYLPHLKGRFPKPVFSARDFDRVPVEACYHLKLTNRPGQSRGVPFLTPCLQDLRDLDLLIEAALKRSQVAACLAAFIKSEEETPDLMGVTAKDFGYVLDEPLQGGSLFRLFPGEDVTTMPASEFGADFETFIRLLARRIGAALGVSWQLVLKDFSQANYSSARTDQLEARKIFRAHQQKLIGCLDWIFREAMGYAAVAGSAPTTAEGTWLTPGWEWVDPQKEVAAIELALAVGVTTLRDVCAERGKDWREVVRQKLLEEQFEMQERKRLGLPDPAEQDAQTPEAAERRFRAVA